jgi:hypothetical protein
MDPTPDWLVALRPSKALVLRRLDRFEALAKDLLRELDPPEGTDNVEARGGRAHRYVRRERLVADEWHYLLPLLLTHVSLCRGALRDGGEPWKAAFHMHEVCAIAQRVAAADPDLQRMLYVADRVIGAGRQGHNPLLTEQRHAQYRAEYEQHRRAGLGKMAARNAVAKKHGVTERTLRRVGCNT